MSVFLNNSSSFSSSSLTKCNTILIKVGTNSIVNCGELNKLFLTELIYESSKLIRQGKRVLIVTSGAVGLGKAKIKFNGEKPYPIKTQQGLAAIGQISLVNEYQQRFEAIGLECAQVLVSQRDLLDKNCFDNINSTFEFLFENKVIPIINENDVVATEELRNNSFFSDNDMLAALLASKIKADLFVMITSKNGLIGNDGKVLEFLEKESQLLKMNEQSKDGRGGIEAKLKAIKLANQNECVVFVTGPDSFKGFSEGEAKGTLARLC